LAYSSTGQQVNAEHDSTSQRERGTSPVSLCVEIVREQQCASQKGKGNSQYPAWRQSFLVDEVRTGGNQDWRSVDEKDRHSHAGISQRAHPEGKVQGQGSAGCEQPDSICFSLRGVVKQVERKKNNAGKEHPEECDDQRWSFLAESDEDAAKGHCQQPNGENE
jgi:hypothetical protein